MVNARQSKTGRFVFQSADAKSIEYYWAQRPLLSDIRPVDCLAASADSKGRFAVYSRTEVKKRKRFEILKRDGFTCQYCGRKPPLVTLHVDHIIPVVEGGTNNKGNLITSCSSCNLGKGGIPLIKPWDFLMPKQTSMEIRERYAAFVGRLFFTLNIWWNRVTNFIKRRRRSKRWRQRRIFVTTRISRRQRLFEKVKGVNPRIVTASAIGILAGEILMIFAMHLLSTAGLAIGFKWMILAVAFAFLYLLTVVMTAAIVRIL